jgi:hypothetical protein
VNSCEVVCCGHVQCKLPSNNAALLQVVFMNLLRFKESFEVN